MPHHRITIFGGLAALTSFVAVGLGTAAGAAGGYGAPAMGSSPAPTVKSVIRLHSASKPATVRTTKATVDGKTETILVDTQGLPLYYFPADTAKKSLVSGELARLWPPLLSTKPTATGTQGKLTALPDASGHQVTYNGHFLYTFIDDSPGRVTGQGISNFFVATPRLKAISSTPKPTAAASSSSSSSSSSGSGYGY
jgi:predicted lipoprotein with Yx(FWY)xxD motif